MKVYYFSGELLGCVYVRALLPMWHNGWNGNVVSLKTPHNKSIQQIQKEMMEADVIVFHRPEVVQYHKIGKILKDAGKKIVFDNDDTFKLDKYHPFFNVDDKNFNDNLKFKNNILNNFILNSDLVTTSTDYLKEEYSKINPNVITLPNYIDPSDWDDEIIRNEGDKVRIGIVGSVAYSHDYEVIKDIIKKLANRDDVQLVLFGLNSFNKNKLGENKEDERVVKKVLGKEIEFWNSLKNVEHTYWTPMANYFHKLNSLALDMMLIPRRDNNFNKAKSNIKFLEASMCEIPVIASNFDGSPYAKDIDGTNGILVDKEEDWIKAIDSLVKDKKKRREMGKKAKEYVLANYNIEDHAHKWEDAYKKLLK